MIILLHEVIDFLGPNIVLSFHVDWLGIVLVQASHMFGWRQTDKHTD